jgi:hypothetical protein
MTSLHFEKKFCKCRRGVPPRSEAFPNEQHAARRRVYTKFGCGLGPRWVGQAMHREQAGMQILYAVPAIIIALFTVTRRSLLKKELTASPRNRHIESRTEGLARKTLAHRERNFVENCDHKESKGPDAQGNRDFRQCGCIFRNDTER